MEHRWGQRVPVNIPVRLESPPISIGTATVLDLSVSGAWIGGDFERHVSAEIEVVFELQRGRSAHPYRLPAFVARAHRDGIGVEWRDLAPPLISELLGAAMQTEESPAENRAGESIKLTGG
jgi:hypothetical protein